MHTPSMSAQTWPVQRVYAAIRDAKKRLSAPFPQLVGPKRDLYGDGLWLDALVARSLGARMHFNCIHRKATESRMSKSKSRTGATGRSCRDQPHDICFRC